jgi:hypothetical protein
MYRLVNWQNRMFSQKVGNKLRTYKLFKEVFETEMHLSKNIPSRYMFYYTVLYMQICMKDYLMKLKGV